MSNSWFQFKQFRIAQDACAMKVSTDACIQGAWTPVRSHVKNVLDIGTGTGLLALMLAQKAPDVLIDGIELDPAAAQQAVDNAASSPWADRVRIVQADVRAYRPAYTYDLIICNPPFFSNSLLGSKQNRNMARHALELSSEDLLSSIKRLLSPQGYASVLLPVAEHEVWERRLRQNNCSVMEKLLVKPTRDLPVNRVVSLCSMTPEQSTNEKELLIYEADRSYTPEFIQLLQPFYLNL